MSRNNSRWSVARRGARLAAERSEGERSGAKRRGRGLGRRNTNFLFCKGIYFFIKNLQITTVFLTIYPDKLCEKEAALHTLLFFLFYEQFYSPIQSRCA